MSLLNKASLIQIPSGYKDGTLYSAKPTNGDGDFTFSRGSNLAATRVNSDGLIEKGRENVLLQSNQFDTTWTKSNASVTSGQSGYDGSSDAWLLESSTNGSAYIQQTSTQSGVQTFSFYAKAGTTDWVRVIGASSPDYLAFYDLTNGVVGATLGGANIDTSIQSVGGGWYRCSISGNATISRIILNVAEADNDILVSIGDNIYIQDAQLELGLVATDYIETGASTAQAGILEDMPRLDYSGGASCGSLILEPQRTNNIPQSEYFGSGSGWSFLNNVTLGDFVLSPEGKMNATELVFDGTTGGRIERTIGGLTAAADYSVSIYARVASGTQDVVFGATADETFTLTTDWQRLTRTEAENDANAFPRFRCDDAATIEIFGFQHEAGSYPTSYIPTYGSSSTRSKDSCSKTGISSLIGQTEGTMFCEMGEDVNFGTVTSSIFCLDDNTANNRIELSITPTGNGRISFYISNGGTEQVNILSASTLSANDKIAVTYKANDFVVYLNGTAIDTDTSGSVPTTNIARIAQRYDGGRTEKNSFKQVILFPTRLSNDELASLTTL